MIGEECADARIPLAGLVDLRVRRVAIASEAYRTLWADMIRLKAEDFERSEPRRALAAAGSLSEEAFVPRFGSLADRATPVLSTFRSVGRGAA